MFTDKLFFEEDDTPNICNARISHSIDSPYQILYGATPSFQFTPQTLDDAALVNSCGRTVKSSLLLESPELYLQSSIGPNNLITTRGSSIPISVNSSGFLVYNQHSYQSELKEDWSTSSNGVSFHSGQITSLVNSAFARTDDDADDFWSFKKILTFAKETFTKLTTVEETVSNASVDIVGSYRLGVLGSVVDYQRDQIELRYAEALAYIDVKDDSIHRQVLRSLFEYLFENIRNIAFRLERKIIGLINAISRSSKALDKRLALRRKMKVFFTRKDDEEIPTN